MINLLKVVAASFAHEPAPETQQEVICFLLGKGADIQETDSNGVTALHRAVRFQSVAAIEKLLRQGADVNVVDRRSGSTPLHRAMTSTGAPSTAGKMNEAAAIIRILLSNGADPEVSKKAGRTPNDYARNALIRDALAAR